MFLKFFKMEQKEKFNNEFIKNVSNLSSEFLDLYLNFIVYDITFNDFKSYYLIYDNKNYIKEKEKVNEVSILLFLSIKKDFNFEFTEYINLFDGIYHCLCNYFYKHLKYLKKRNKTLTERNIYNTTKLLNNIIEIINELYFSLQNEYKEIYISIIKKITKNFLKNKKKYLFNLLTSFN